MTFADTLAGKLADSEDEIRLMDHPDSTEEIPVLDMGPFLNGEPAGREAVALHLREISETIGFFYVKNHGVPEQLVERVFVETRRFHSLPEEIKRETPHAFVDSFQVGYQPMNSGPPRTNVNIIKDAKPNLLSKFIVSRELPTSDPNYKPINVWPNDLPGFRQTVSEYHQRIEALGRQFLPLWATSLDMPLDFFDRYFASPHLSLSLLHYPPQKTVGNRQYGIAPHTDNSFMTFLAQSEIPGLAVRMPSGHWRIVANIPGTLLVNTGNVMVRWTNGRYLSTKHRVINTANVDRYSIPVFFGPSRDAMIDCISSCVSPTNPCRFESMTYEQLRSWYYGMGTK